MQASTFVAILTYSSTQSTSYEPTLHIFTDHQYTPTYCYQKTLLYPYDLTNTRYIRTNPVKQ